MVTLEFARPRAVLTLATMTLALLLASCKSPQVQIAMEISGDNTAVLTLPGETENLQVRNNGPDFVVVTVRIPEDPPVIEEATIAPGWDMRRDMPKHTKVEIRTRDGGAARIRIDNRTSGGLAETTTSTAGSTASAK